MTRGNPASYDIQIANDATTGDRKVTDMLEIFLPTQDLATSLLGGLASFIDTTGKLALGEPANIQSCD
jgi:hypothetical protein